MILIDVGFPGITQAEAGVANLGAADFTCTAPFLDPASTWTVQVEAEENLAFGGTSRPGLLRALAAVVERSGGVVRPQPPIRRIGWLPQARHAHQPPRFQRSVQSRGAGPSEDG